MNRRLLTVLLGLTLAAPVSATSLIDGDADAGKAKSITCAACHGADGNSINPEWPNLAGQHAKYSVAQLYAFREGHRENVLMTSQAMILDEAGIRDLAVYFESQAPKQLPVADADTIEKGRKLYIAGNGDQQVSACIACHGPAGKGNPAAAYPKVGGQHATYTAKALRDYASGARKSADGNQIMNNVASALSEEDIVALASYIQGLY
ncbi:MAG: c-type cytochrome [Pseudomonadota bacterium]